MENLPMISMFMLFFVSEFIAYNCVDLLKREYIQDVKTDMCFRPHADMSFILNMFFLGRGMIIYRLLREWKTCVVKYLHGIIAAGAVIGNYVFINTAHVGIECFMYPFDNEYSTGSDDSIHWNHNHFKVGRILVTWGFLQVATGILVFVLIYPQPARRFFFGFHNTCGCFYYIVVAAESGMKFFFHQRAVPDNADPKLFCDWLMFQLVLYPIIILSILIVPHFEWPVIDSI